MSISHYVNEAKEMQTGLEMTTARLCSCITEKVNADSVLRQSKDIYEDAEAEFLADLEIPETCKNAESRKAFTSGAVARARHDGGMLGNAARALEAARLVAESAASDYDQSAKMFAARTTMCQLQAAILMALTAEVKNGNP